MSNDDVLLAALDELNSQLEAIRETLDVIRNHLVSRNDSKSYDVLWDRYGDEWRDYGTGWRLTPTDPEPHSRERVEETFGPVAETKPHNASSHWGDDG